MKRFFEEQKSPIKFLSILLITALFLHKFRIFPIPFYGLLLFIYLIYIIRYIFGAKIILKKTLVTTLYFIFIMLLLLSIVISFRFIGVPVVAGQLDFIDIIIAGFRMLLMPSIVLLLLSLNIDRYNLKILIKLFLLFMCIGAFVMFYQQIFGHLEFLGGIGPERFIGIIPYPSTVGNITIYGSAVGIALIAAVINDNNFYLNFFIVLTLILGAIITGQKSAMINIILAMSFIAYFSTKDFLKILIGLFILLIASVLFYPFIFNAILSLFANTFGFNLQISLDGINNTEVLSEGLYSPIFERFIDRLTGRNWWQMPYDIYAFFIGYGVIGGTGVFGIDFNSFGLIGQYNFSTDGSLDKFSISTLHNQYLDLFQIGGFIMLFVFILLIINILNGLYSRFKLNDDRLALMFILANIILFINCIVANGVLFHPYTSFIFWLSIIYLMINFEVKKKI